MPQDEKRKRADLRFHRSNSVLQRSACDQKDRSVVHLWELDRSSLCRCALGTYRSCVHPQFIYEKTRRVDLRHAVQVSPEADRVTAPRIGRKICPMAGTDVDFE